MKCPLVSVVLAYYNQEAYIGQALDSLAAQDYPYIELLLADDASNDGSNYSIKSALKRSGRRYVRFKRIKNKNRKGLFRTINRAMKSASGVFCCVLYAEDRFSTMHISAMIAAMQNQNAAVAFSDVLAIDKNNNQDIGEPGYYINKLQDDWLYQNCMTQASLDKNPTVCIGSLMFRRKFWKKLDGIFFERPVGDWDLLLRSSLVYEPLYVPYAPYEIRILSETLYRVSFDIQEKNEMLHLIYAALQRGRYRNANIQRYYEQIKRTAFNSGHEYIWKRANDFGGSILINARMQARKTSNSKK